MHIVGAISWDHPGLGFARIKFPIHTIYFCKAECSFKTLPKVVQSSCFSLKYTSSLCFVGLRKTELLEYGSEALGKWKLGMYHVSSMLIYIHFSKLNRN